MANSERFEQSGISSVDQILDAWRCGLRFVWTESSLCWQLKIAVARAIRNESFKALITGFNRPRAILF